MFDCVGLAAAAVPNSMQVALDTLKAVREELGMSPLLGIGNAGFGMPYQPGWICCIWPLVHPGD